MKKFETPVFRMTIHEDGFIEFMVKRDAVFDAQDIWESRAMSLEYLPGRKFYVLLESEGPFNPTVAARDAGSSVEYAGHSAAVAMVSQNLTLKILGNLYIKLSRPIVPTKFFDDRNAAIAWLRERMK
jgi:hypothetical protein